jgi:hypothetical protein
MGSGWVRGIHNGDVSVGVKDSVIETGKADDLDARGFRDREGGVGVGVVVGGGGVEVGGGDGRVRR